MGRCINFFSLLELHLNSFLAVGRQINFKDHWDCLCVYGFRVFCDAGQSVDRTFISFVLVAAAAAAELVYFSNRHLQGEA
jgi:hypothetical protein